MADLRYSDDWLQVWVGDARDALRQMPEKSVHTVCTSPPFYGLRDYGTAVWVGGDDPDCDHKQMAGGRGTNVPQTKNPNVDYPVAPHRGGDPNNCVRCGATRVEPTVWGGDRTHQHAFTEAEYRLQSHGDDGLAGNLGGGRSTQAQTRMGPVRSGTCECGAWRGALGLEPTPEMYVEHLVEVFDEVWRVLRDDGILWLNLGDSYSTSSGRGRGEGGQDGGKIASRLRAQTAGLKSKDLIGIPWLTAFALRTSGWYLRGDIVWAKPNAMPESVDDRPTRSHESIFMLTKSPQYYFDMEAVKETPAEATVKSAAGRMKAPNEDREFQHDSATRMGKRSPNRVWSDVGAMERMMTGRHLRDVWHTATVSYPGAHFATWPSKLVQPMVKAATSERGCCATCGAPWVRVVERLPTGYDGSRYGERAVAATGGAISGGTDASTLGSPNGTLTARSATLGWEPSCDHRAEVVPCTVMDIFGGSGTTAMVAQSLGRRAILVDLNPEYAELQMVRNRDIPLALEFE